MAKNDSSEIRTKHIDIEFHFERNSLSNNLIAIEYLPKNKIVADVLTEPVQLVLLNNFKTELGLLSVPALETVTEEKC